MQLDTSDKNSVSKFAEEVGHKHAGSIGVLVSHSHTRTAESDHSLLCYMCKAILTITRKLRFIPRRFNCGPCILAALDR